MTLLFVAGFGISGHFVLVRVLIASSIESARAQRALLDSVDRHQRGSDPGSVHRGRLYVGGDARALLLARAEHGGPGPDSGGAIAAAGAPAAGGARSRCRDFARRRAVRPQEADQVKPRALVIGEKKSLAGTAAALRAEMRLAQRRRTSRTVQHRPT